jgi:hypothetical protein
VRDRLLNDRAPAEVIAEPFFQRRDFPFFHKWGQVGSDEYGDGSPRPSAECQLGYS